MSSTRFLHSALFAVTLVFQVWFATTQQATPSMAASDAHATGRRLATDNQMVSGITPTSVSVSIANEFSFTGTADGGPTTNARFLFVADSVGTCPDLSNENLVSCNPACTGTQTFSSTGTYNLCFRGSAEIDNVFMTTDGFTKIALTVIATTSHTQVTAISPTTITMATATAITLTTASAMTAGTLATWAQNCVGASPNVAVSGSNPSVTFTVSGYGSNFRLCLRAPGGSDSIAQDNVFLTVDNPSVGNDPVAWFGDRFRVFNFPPGKMMPLLEASDMMLHGSTFEYEGPWQQWFGHMVVASPDGSRWVQIKTRNDILEFNRSRATRGHFETLEITLGHGSFDNPSARTLVPNRDVKIPLSFLGLDLLFWKMPKSSKATNTMIGSAHRECLEVAGADVHILVCSAPAAEFFGWQRHLAIKNAHLDLEVIEVKSQDALKGILPELWGLVPMSKTTESYITEDLSTNVGISLPDVPKGVSLPAGKGWAGGLGVKDASFCHEENKTEAACELDFTVKTAMTV